MVQDLNTSAFQDDSLDGILADEKTEVEEDIDLLEDLENSSKLIVHNDDVNTFDWVIESLVEICDHTQEQAEQCSLIIHFKGKAQVKEGSHDDLKPMKDGLTDRGISATIEQEVS
ncbi:MAG: Clp protease ClpS [Bacteroidetes bacterium SW_11_45_7]|nr:MAG: Clp protease ClpS [Bacteroidetes bacterium SW_11_45_7]